MINNNRRGSILIHVLITGVVVSTIAAGLMKMVLMNYIIVDKATKGTQNRKEAEATLSNLISYWNANGVCSNFSGYTCSSGASPCTCTGPAAAGSATSPRVTVSGAAPGPYNIEVTSSDPQ